MLHRELSLASSDTRRERQVRWLLRLTSALLQLICTAALLSIGWFSPDLWTNSRRGDGIFDPFAGSGSTLIAAETMGRRCFAMEINPAFCDLIVKRWEAFTGQTAGPYPNFVRP
jgi:DNA methylase